MGLLNSDVFDSDQFRLGLGLLGAASARTDGAGFGQRLMEGFGSFDNFRKQKDAKKLDDLKMQEILQSIEDKKVARENMKAGLSMLSPHPEQPKIGQMGSGTFGILSSGGESPYPETPTTSDIIAKWTPEQVLTYERLTGQKVTDVWKAANEGWKREPGAVYAKPGGGMEMGPPKISENMQLRPDGRGGFVSSVVPGAVDAISALTGAQESAKAGYDFVDVPLGDGTTQKMTRQQYAQLTRQPEPQQPAMPSSIPSIGNKQPSAYDLARIQADAKANGIENPFINFSRPQIGVTQNPAQAIREAETAKADVVRSTASLADAKRYGQMSTNIDRAIELLKKGPTNSGIGEAVDYVAGKFGVTPKGAEIADQLDTLSGWMTANVPRMEGPQSDRDVVQYQIMAGRVGNRSLPVERRLAAAQEVKLLQDKYANLNGFGGSSSSESPANKVVDSLPTPNAANRGQRIRDTVTGKILVSNGLQWRAE